LIIAAPIVAQTTEFGVLFGGSKRVVKNSEAASGSSLLNPGFSLSNSSVDIYYALQVDPGTMFKVQVGRIDGPVAFKETQTVGGDTVTVRRDLNGQVQHAEGLVEYRFSSRSMMDSSRASAGVTPRRSEPTTDYGLPGDRHF
jgi:hypothetical protein